jgi:hypothetical protein
LFFGFGFGFGFLLHVFCSSAVSCLPLIRSPSTPAPKSKNKAHEAKLKGKPKAPKSKTPRYKRNEGFLKGA